MNDQDEMFDQAISTCREHVKPVVREASEWRISPEQRGGGWAIECDSHGVIAVAIQRDKHPLAGKEVTWDEAAANARLIAAAPKLLEAVTAMIEWDARESDFAIGFNARLDLCHQAFEKARAAFAKATGDANLPPPHRSRIKRPNSQRWAN